MGAPPWPLQRAWAARVVQGRSFAMLAPTGIGKTTFGLLTALWLAREGRRSYLVFPTRLLVAQAAERLRALGAPFVAYTGKPKEKEALLEWRAPHRPLHRGLPLQKPRPAPPARGLPLRGRRGQPP